MHGAITHLSFADWVYFIFDHPAEGPQWYWADDAPFWNGPAPVDRRICQQAFRGAGRPWRATAMPRSTWGSTI